MKVHHIGLIVRDIDKSIKIYKRINYIQKTGIIFDEHQNIKICFLENDFHRLELIQSLDETSSIYHFKDGYHHICYEVYDENFVENFIDYKIGKIFSQPTIAPAIENRCVVFGCLSNGAFVEFLLNSGEK